MQFILDFQPQAHAMPEIIVNTALIHNNDDGGIETKAKFKT